MFWDKNDPIFPRLPQQPYEEQKGLCKCLMCAFTQTGVPSHAAALLWKIFQGILKKGGFIILILLDV